MARPWCGALRLAGALCALGALIGFAQLDFPGVAVASRATDLAGGSPLPAQPESAAVTGAPSVLEAVVWRLRHELHKASFQNVFALLAVCFGLVTVFDGETAFTWLILGATCVVTGLISMGEVGDAWGLSEHGFMRHLIGLEIGTLCAFAAWQGFRGVLVFAGAALGVLVAWCACSAAEGWFGHVDEWAAAATYSIFALAFVEVVRREKHVRLLYVLSPFAGGSLVVSGSAFIVTELAMKYADRLPALQRCCSPQSGDWVDFLEMVWTPRGGDLGLFSAERFHSQVLGDTLQLNRILCWCCWLLLFVIGTAAQCRKGSAEANAREVGACKMSAPLLAA